MKRRTLCIASMFALLCLLSLVTLNTSATNPKRPAKAMSVTAGDRADRDSRTDRRDENAAPSRPRQEKNELGASTNRRNKERGGLLNRLSGFFKGLFVHEEEAEGENETDDPDFLPSLRGKVDPGEYLAMRQEWVNMKLGMTPGVTYDPTIRVSAIEAMDRQEAELRAQAAKGVISPAISGTTWTNLGPYPIPNGQTSGRVDPVSGRTVAIAIHPTDPNIVYVGTAQGGVYRSVNGGTTWTQLFNNAQSQVIGALALAPSNPEILYVGTGEAGQCGSGCYAGIGVYRIDNASTTATLTGPINPLRNYNDGSNNPTSANIFTGRAISKILVNPTDQSIIFVSTTSAIVGNPQQAPFGGTVPPLGLRGIYRLANATGPPAGVTFTKLTVNAVNCFDTPCTGNQSVLDMVFDPGDATGNTIVCWARPVIAVGDGGVFRTTTAQTTATFTQTLAVTQAANTRGELDAVRIGGVTTMYLASGEVPAGAAGRLRVSIDGGQTWSLPLAGASGFCNPQCFYDIAIAIDPTDANVAYVGGAAGTNILRKTTDGFATVANTPSTQVGLHADDHVIAIAPSNHLIVYEGNDGGIWRSTDAGANWTSLNNTTFVATQFQSISMHPTDRWFSIGGTQDNGTNFLQPNADVLPFGGWTRADFGDGGYARIDQTAADTTNVVMYHTYFNQTNNLIGFARTSSVACATQGNWAFKGFGAGVFTNACGDVEGANGIAGTDNVLFYAPLELGPPVLGSQGQTVYFGTDRLYRSINKGDTMTVVSSVAPGAIVAGQVITTIAIAPLDDNYRFVGLMNGNVWGSTTGSPPFVNVTPPITSARAVGKIVIDPNNKNTALVAYDGQFGTAAPATQHIWRTTNLNAASPTWTAVGNGIPDVPVNALVYDPVNSKKVYAGTDIGVFTSQDSGLDWTPFGSGLPRIAVFDMAVQNANRILRIATHGRGFWEITLFGPTATEGTVRGTILDVNGAPVSGVTIHMDGTQSRVAITDANGNYRFDDVETSGLYTVTPSRANYAFSPASRSFSLLGQQANASFTAAAIGGVIVSPLDTTEFFVRQQYLDFLGREPDALGFSAWVNTINNCAAGDTTCDRVHVSEMFFRSAEFQDRGYYIYRFYSTAFGRKPQYAEFTPDMTRVSGFLTTDRLEAAKMQFAIDFTNRPVFAARYAGLSNAAYVDALTATAQVGLANRQTIIDALDNGAINRAQALRIIVESSEVYQQYYNQAFVVMEYFGYLRRDPDALYTDWINVLNQSGDARHMVEGFVNSIEYRNRFKQ